MRRSVSRSGPVLAVPSLPPRPPVAVAFLRRAPRTRVEHFPMERPASHTLRSARVRWAGIDHLAESFHAGTPVSATHLVYIPLEGSVECDCGRGARTLGTGWKLVAPARGPHWIRLRRGRCDALWFHLDDAPRWRGLLRGGPRIERVVEGGALARTAREALREAVSTAFGAADNLAHYCGILVNLLERELGTGGARPHVVERLDGLWRRVAGRPGEPWTVATLAREAGMGAGYFHAVMNDLAGVTPMRMLARLRMEHAAALLLNTDLTVAAVAEEAGYGSPYAFSDAFLRFSGRRPGRYRRRAGTRT